jgi:hypothetical protein
MYQTPKTPKMSRADHVWVERRGGGYKCCLCGAVTDERPPPFPTAKDWMPVKFDKLTAQERELAPFRGPR